MKKIVIIGGGIAGLSAGCYAQMNGHNAHIFEMHNLPGGLCTSWKRNGYTFDLCIHWLDGSSPDSPFHRIWQELGAIQGKRIHYKEIALKVFINDKIINFYNEPEKLANYFKEIAPEDSEIIDELVYCQKKFYQLSDMPLTKAKELFNIIDKFKGLKSFLPLMRVFKKYGKMTIDEFVARFKNPILKQAILTIKAVAKIDDFIAIPAILATKDSGFPECGSLNFAKSIEQRFINLGGKIKYGSKINKIIVNNNKAVGVQLEDGTEVKADIIISAADGYTTIFKMLEGKFINKKITHCYENEPTFPSYLQVSIGVDMDLSDNAYSIYDIHKLDKLIMIGEEKHNYITLKNYTFDPTLSPKGKSNLVVGFNSDSDYWENLYKDKEKYKQEKKNVEKAVISCLEKIIPNIQERIETIDVATPMTIIRYTNNWKGSIMGFLNFFSLKLPRTLPKLENFFMAGQWVGGYGVPGAAKSGRDCIEYICKKDKKQFITTKP